MHELSLFGQVPLTRLEQVLNILAGLSAMQPQSFYEAHTILAPRPLSKDATKPAPKRTTREDNKPSTYQHLIQPLRHSDFGNDPGSSTTATGTQKPSIRIRTADVPEPETKAFLLRRVEEATVPVDDAQKYDDETKYRRVLTYYLEGQRLICKDVVLSLYRNLIAKTGQEAVQVGKGGLVPAIAEMELVDASGGFVLEATVRIEDRSKTVLMQRAMEGLGWLKGELKGVVELRVPERLSLDTRVRE